MATLVWVRNSDEMIVYGGCLKQGAKNAVRLRADWNGGVASQHLRLKVDESNWARLRRYLGGRASWDSDVPVTPLTSRRSESARLELGCGPRGQTTWYFEDERLHVRSVPLTVTAPGVTVDEKMSGIELKPELKVATGPLEAGLAVASGTWGHGTTHIYSCQDPQLACTVLLPWLQGPGSLRDAIGTYLQPLDAELDLTRIEEIPALSAIRPEGWEVWLDDGDRSFWLGEGESRDVTVNIQPGPPGTAVAFALRVTDNDGGTVVGDIVAAVSTDESSDA